MKLLIEVQNLTKRSKFITRDNVISRWLKVMDKAPTDYAGSAFGPRFVFNLKKSTGDVIETRYSNEHIYL